VTHYEVLGVPPTAARADVRRAFLALARREHPDVHATADAATRRSAQARMQAVNDAWAVLGDTQRRAAYDAELRRAASRFTAEPRPSQGWGGAAASGRPAGSPGGGPFAGSPGGGYAAAGTAARPADWRRHASPGAGVGRSPWARAVAVLPVGLLVLAALLAGLSALTRAQELASLAGAVALMAVLAFLAAPIFAMKEARRAQRRPRRR
jgi:hypothetical protein